MRLFLIRHGESAGNVDKSLHLTLADHAIPLTERGTRQAYDAGKFLREYIETNLRRASIVHDSVNSPEHPNHESFFYPSIRMWCSPYKRTRQTAAEVMKAVNENRKQLLIQDQREHINLSEQQFGLFDGIPDDQLEAMFPQEYAHYEKTLQHEGKFWARMPLGESRFDVAVRVHQAFGTFHRDAARHGIDNLVIICHGTTLRAFLMQWLHHTPEWFAAEPNPKNCCIRLLEDSVDRGYIYQGGF